MDRGAGGPAKVPPDRKAEESLSRNCVAGRDCGHGRRHIVKRLVATA